MAPDRFADRFGGVASDYAKFRPTYPDALFEVLARLAPRRRLAWDCATGNGQAACALARHFDGVVASDASAAQLAAATNVDARVKYVRGRAEAAPFVRCSFDLVTVAQALHWFDIPAFWREVRHALVPGGIIAVWCYSLCRVAPDIDLIVDRFYREVVGPFWAPQRALTDTGYRTVEFPFRELTLRVPDMTAPLTLQSFLGYVGTWSASQGYRASKGEDPIVLLRKSLEPLWGPGRAREVRWPLHVRIGVHELARP